MADECRVDPDGMHDSSKQFEEVGRRMRSIANDFTRITDVDPSWFEGEIGEEFKKNFSPARQNLIEGGQNLAEGLMGIGQGVRAMAVGYGNADQGAVQSSQRLEGLMQQDIGGGSGAGGGAGGSGQQHQRLLRSVELDPSESDTARMTNRIQPEA